MVVELKKSSPSPRFCKSCQSYKPPRSHHCSDCNACILRMDHHCPWVNTCVGQNNLGHFYRFLVVTSFGVVYCVGLIAYRLWALIRLSKALDRYYRTPWPHDPEVLAPYATPQATTKELAFMIINIILCFILLFTVFILTIFQTVYIGANTTTIETYERDRIESLVTRGVISKERAANPYDLGYVANFKQVLGKMWWAWLLPQSAEGDGISFEVNEGARKNGQLVEHEGRKYVLVTYPPPEYYQHYGKRRREEADSAAEAPDMDVGEQNGGEEVQRREPRVRRGSEGYVVRTMTEEERERLLVASGMNAEENEEEDEEEDLLEKAKVEGSWGLSAAVKQKDL